MIQNSNDRLFTHFGDSYNVGQLIQPTLLHTQYNVVIHIRLEDFIEIGQAIHPDCVKSIVDSVYHHNSCIVLNKPKTTIEEAYVNYVKGDHNIIIESNDIITDFHIMKHAKVLVCSMSTLSWAAALLSDTVETVFVPDYPHTRIHETYRRPSDNTVSYPIKTCSKGELVDFLQKL
jgi:hypothetical protein